ncbi:LCP family glycopolymer transferase [Streptoalloteichus tenebrarius]|uniref:LCP family glycopolymer transferase n=1 Tax=Streptoalloteichus tenebrarius (strain ATCC 17920 / DSM 40477 / JCM 4838 / CBS 697.72 / NBRC 16177 / NCIMB 11028 / NRRL B-12390 / A12253. 1 / ISP 5477) TaxID=1933 RepID=UPI0035ED31F4
MPDDPRDGFGSRRSRRQRDTGDPQGDQARDGAEPRDARRAGRGYEEPPTGRRRRSREDSGGVSVSDLLAKHGTGQYPIPGPPSADEPARAAEDQPSRRDLPAPGRPRRAADEPSRPAMPAPGAVPPATGRGRPVDEPSRPAMPAPNPTGRRAVDEPSRPAMRAPRTTPPVTPPGTPTPPTGRGRPVDEPSRPAMPAPGAPAPDGRGGRPTGGRARQGQVPGGPPAQTPSAPPTPPTPPVGASSPPPPVPPRGPRQPAAQEPSGRQDAPTPQRGSGPRPMPTRKQRPAAAGDAQGPGSRARMTPPGAVPPPPVPPSAARPDPGVLGSLSGEDPTPSRPVPQPPRPTTPPPPGATPPPPGVTPPPPAGAAPVRPPAGPPTPAGPPVPGAARRPARQGGVVPPAGPSPEEVTQEVPAVGDGPQDLVERHEKSKKIDATLARFSAVHDEALEAEQKKRNRLTRFIRRDELPDLDAAAEATPSRSGESRSGESRSAEPRGSSPRPPADEEETTLLPPATDEPEGAEEPARAEKGAKRDVKRDAGKDEEPAESDPAVEGRPRNRRRALLVGKGLAVAAAALVFVASGIGWGGMQWADSKFRKVMALDPDSADIQDKDKQLGDENFLLVGSDTRAGAKAEDHVGTQADADGARSDSVMIAHIPQDRSRVVVVSFPRDLEVDLPECDQWNPDTGQLTGKKTAPRKNAKINEAYAAGGPMCTNKVVQKISGLAINHFLGVDFHGFKGMVNAVDGVEVCIPKPMIDEKLGPIFPQAGKKVLRDNDALNFVRARYLSNDPTSDYGRMKRQQQFLSALLRKVMSSQVLLDPGKLTSFVSEVGKNTFGDNVGVDQLLTLAQSMRGVSAGQITFVTVPTVGNANARGNEVLRVDDTRALFRAIIDGTPLPGEKPAQGSPVPQAQAPQGGAAVDPKTVKLQVVNGSGRDGAGKETADALAAQGFTVVTRRDGERGEKTQIRHSGQRAAQARTLKSAVPSAELVEDPSLGGAIQLVLGANFDGRVVKPGSEPPQGEQKPGDQKPPAGPLPNDLSTVNAADDGPCG